MPHAIWSGAINFGLVSIPVKLHTAVKSNDLRFHFLHDADQGRLSNVRVCSTCGKRVDWENVVRGFEYDKEQYVVLTDEDFKRVDPEATQSVDIVEFGARARRPTNVIELQDVLRRSLQEPRKHRGRPARRKHVA